MKWLWLIILGLPLSLQATTYYVDSVAGNDVNAGTTATAPWKTLQKVDESQFGPGDRILLKAGSEWQGQFAPKGCGAEGSPIVIDRYGEGAMPHIDGAGIVEDAVRLYNSEEIEIHNLEITNHGDKPAIRRGVHIILDNFGTARHIVIADLYIHDVNGINEGKWDNGGIIYRCNGEKKPTRFDGLIIERNILWRVDRSGLFGVSYHNDRAHWYPSLHVVIRDNYVEEAGGDSLVPRGIEGALVEHNVSTKCNARANAFAGGIWPQDADNTLLILNDSSFCKGTKDGEGFNADFNTKNSTLRFNYSHDNDGGFMLVCTPAKLKGDLKQYLKSENNIGNTGTTLQYNISRNDHTRLFNLDGGIRQVRIENNAFYVSPGLDVQLLASAWEGWPEGVTVKQNTFYVGGTLRFGHATGVNKDGSYEIGPGWAPAKDVVFEGNKYFGKTVDRPEDATGGVADSFTAPPLDWNAPTFDPRHPEGLREFMSAHRKWMIKLFQQQFGQEPQ